VFKLAPDGTETVLYAFKGGAYGWYPSSLTRDDKGNFYGTTFYGGLGTSDNGNTPGVIFEIRSDGTLTVLYQFKEDRDGYNPGNLIKVRNKLYGTTQSGGIGKCPVGCGTLFSFDLATGAESTLYTFCSEPNCSDGGGAGSLLEIGGTLYGEAGGGAYGGGIVFSFAPATETETVLYSFCTQQHCADGDGPTGGLIQYDNGLLYGTTAFGGNNLACRENQGSCGTVFSVDPKTGSEAVLHTFSGNGRGSLPSGGVVADGSGSFYGTTTGMSNRHTLIFTLKKYICGQRCTK
jgi:uncharacterized repeat protein (TIGR03803 family)